MAIHSEAHASPRHLGEPWRLPDGSNWGSKRRARVRLRSAACHRPRLTADECESCHGTCRRRLWRVRSTARSTRQLRKRRSNPCGDGHERRECASRPILLCEDLVMPWERQRRGLARRRRPRGNGGVRPAVPAPALPTSMSNRASVLDAFGSNERSLSFQSLILEGIAFSEVVIPRRRSPPSMYQAHVQFPPLLAGAIGRDAPDYERQEQKQRNGVPRPMIRRGFGIVPISVLIRLGHFKSLGFNRRPSG